MEIITGKILRYNEDGSVIIHAALPSLERACLRQYSEVTIGLPDGRTITPEQRRKAYALMGEIVEWSGHTLDQTKLIMKRQFMDEHMHALEKQLFSLADCDLTTAREFISYLIEFILTFDVPTHVPLVELCEDVKQYVYACVMHIKCAVCGLKTEFHHVDRVGMGRNRVSICHLGMRCLPLCARHHKDIEIIGHSKFVELYHLEPIEITAEIAKLYKLGKAETRREA